MTAPTPEYDAYAPQDTESQREQQPQMPTGKPRRMIPLHLTIIVGVVALIVGSIIGGFAVYGSARNLTATAKTQINGLQTQNQTLNDQNNDLRDQVNDLQTQLDSYEQQQDRDESGVPQANPNTSGLTILERNVTTRYGSTVIDYVVRNDTDTTFDDIVIYFRYLDADGNTVSSGGMTNNASVDPGKTGTVTVYAQAERENYPSIVGVQAEEIYGEVDGQRYEAELGDEPVVNF